MSSSKRALTILLQLYLFSQYLEVKFIFDQTLFKVFPDLYIMTRQPDTYFFFLFFLTFRPAQTVLGTVSKSAQRKCGYRPRLSLSLSACLYVCLSDHIFLCLSVRLSVCLFLCLSVCVSLSLSVSVSVCLCISFCHPSTSQSYLSLSLSLLRCLCLSVYLSLWYMTDKSVYLSLISLCLCFCLSVCVSVCVSVCLSLSLLLLLCPLHLE